MAKQKEQETQAAEAQVQETSLLDQILTEGKMARDEFQTARAKDMIGEFVSQVMSGELTLSKNMDATINARIAEIDRLLTHTGAADGLAAEDWKSAGPYTNFK